MSVCAASAATLAEFDDTRIRTRMEACRMGMQQLEEMRTKHTKLMQDIRTYYPPAALEEVKVVARVKKPREAPMSPAKNVAPFITNERYEDLRQCESPVSQCYSHRSSVSIDSGCASITSDQLNSSIASLNTQRKASIDESASLVESLESAMNSSMSHMIATAIASTTAVRPTRRYMKNWQRERPRSMYASVPDNDGASTPNYLDHHSFSQITPPPSQRKFATVSRTESFHQAPFQHHSMTNLASPEPVNCARVTPMPKSSEALPNAVPLMSGITVNGQKPLAPRPMPRTLPQPPPRNSIKPQSSPSVYHTARVYVQQKQHRPVIKMCDTVPPTFIAHPALVVSRSRCSGSSTDSSPVPIRRTYVVQPIRRSERSPKTEKRWFESESL